MLPGVPVPDSGSAILLASAMIPLPAWVRETGPDQDVVVASRCRLARNVAGEPFPWRSNEAARKRVALRVIEASERAGPPLNEAPRFAGHRLDAEAVRTLLRWRYATCRWVEDTGRDRWLWVLPDGVGSLLLHEEDHVRLQVLLPGLQLDAVVDRALQLADSLERCVPFAHDSEIGYLTASITNAGTGMRLSVLLHLPGLAERGEASAALRAAVDLGCAVRGAHGEGSRGTGRFIQLSNRWAFGQAGGLALSRVRAAAAYLVEQERKARAVAFGESAGRARLQEAAREALRSLDNEESAPEKLQLLVSVLRLAAAEGVLQARMTEAAEWLAIAGGQMPSTFQQEALARFEAVRRSAEVRNCVRRLRVG